MKPGAARAEALAASAQYGETNCYASFSPTPRAVRILFAFAVS
jgi:hypothetical protein